MSPKIKKILRSFLLIAIVAVLLCSIPVEAATFYSYVYNNDQKSVGAPDAAEAVITVSGSAIGTKGFNMPQDIFLFDNQLFVVDTGNNRIVITDVNFSSSQVIEKFINNGKEDTFQEPEGICVTDDAIYVADTKNSRIVKLDRMGKLQLIIEDPQDESFDDDFLFKPTKVYIDQHDRIFVISAGYNMGLMQFNADGTFLKSLGAPKTTLTVFEQIRRKFQTKEQRQRTMEVVPTEYSNLTISPDGFIFVTSESTSEDVEALRMLNSAGKDVINRVGDPSGDIVTGNSTTYSGNSAIVDVCEVGPDGNRAILDRKRSRVFVYDKDCKLLYMFAGPGTYNGGMSVPTGMVYKDSKFFITDKAKNAICVYELTDYGKTYNKIAKAKSDIDYVTEEKLWEEVLDKNANCTMALSGLGSAAFKHHNMSEAMHYFKLAEDRENYSKAFSFVRREWIENNIIILLIIVAVVIAAFIFYGKFKQRYVLNAPKDSFLSKFEFTNYITFHPLDGFWVLKREKRGSYGIAAIWFGATIVVMVLSNLFNGFIFNTNDLQTYNMFFNVAVVTIAVLLWSVAQWCVTSLMDGEGKFPEILVATCYSLRPYVILNIIATLLSRVLLQTEGDFYTVLTGLALFWVALLLITSVMQTHNYSLGKTILVIVIILVVILLIVFICMLVFALMQQAIAFVTDLITEATLRI